ncbi:MAG: hypothetical protein WC661_21650 [Opitutaceae bacterium]|jgi:hypothetical protein
MKRITLVFLLCIATVVRAEDTDAAKHFSYPDAVLHIDGLIKGKLKPSKNFSHEKDKPEAKWQFRSSASIEVAPQKVISVSWEFITKSEYGDIYIISFTDQSMKKASVPLIFDGSHSASVSKNGIDVSISTE